MSSTMEDAFLNALPAGEWEVLKIHQNPGGLMAKASVHADARWLRKSRTVYLKCTLERGGSAGISTGLLAGSEHLEMRRTRLLEATGSKGPLVPLLYVDFIGNPRWLLIAMEPVTTLKAKIAKGRPDVPLALDILEQLAAAKCDGWFHFDICPANTGIRGDGQIVFIDPESYFPISGDDNKVSIGAHKAYRVPEKIYAQCRIEFRKGTFTRECVIHKHDAEVILLAAECCLGQFNGTRLDSETAADWCRASSAPSPLRSFWERQLEDLCTRANPEPWATAAALRALLSASGVSPALPDEPPERLEKGGVKRVARAESFDLASMTTWSDFQSVREAMREGALTPDQLKKYLARVHEVARGCPSQRQWWVELLVITLAFARDPTKAAEIATEALMHHPRDPEFEHDQMVAERSLV